MALKNVFKLFLIIIFVIGTLNFAYANGGPAIGENQAKKVAQKYLDSHNLPYIAITDGYDPWQIKVKDTKTGEIKWIPYFTWVDNFQWINSTKNDGSVICINRYVEFEILPYKVPITAWIVQINDKKGKNVGQIYLDDYEGEILKVIINGKVLKDIIPEGNLSNFIQSTYASDTANQTSPETNNQPETSNTTWIIVATAAIAITLGGGYWKFNGR